MVTTIYTNHHERQVLWKSDLNEKEQADLDWLEDEGQVVRYRGEVYPISEFTTTEGVDEFKGWDGWIAWTYFSGVLIRMASDEDVAVLGTYVVGG